MTKEEKTLLLKDLCARLPYGVQCKYNRILPIGWEVSDPSTDGTLQSIEIETSGTVNVKIDGRLHGLSDFKPYLRSMESMTLEEYDELMDIPNIALYEDGKTITYGREVDWLNKKMFDYRGLIPMRLALPATEGMYN